MGASHRAFRCMCKPFICSFKNRLRLLLHVIVVRGVSF